MKVKINSITGKTVNITLTRDDDTTFTTNVDGFPLADEKTFDEAVYAWAKAHVQGEEDEKRKSQITPAPEVTAKVGRTARDVESLIAIAEVIE